jgi:hypothetical protein
MLVPFSEASTDLQSAPVTITETGLQFGDSTTYSQWEAVGSTLYRMEKSVMWWIGDWVRFGEAKWGEKYKQAIGEAGYSYQTLRNASWISGEFDLSKRLDNIPWASHQ